MYVKFCVQSGGDEKSLYFFSTKQFREAAKYILSLSEEHLAALIERGDFVEVKADEQKIPK